MTFVNSLRWLAILTAAVFCAAGTNLSQASQQMDWTTLTKKLQSFIPSKVSGLTLMIARKGEILYAQAFGNQTISSVLPIASSTKMPSGLVIMSLVDGDLLDLDRSVGEYFQGKIIWPADKTAVTTRMLFNHLSGLADNAPCLNNRRSIGLKECAQEIAHLPLQFAPGTKFAYGNGGMQVAGYLAEAISERSWQDLFTERIAKPLGLTTFTYTDSKNPLIPGGAYSDVGDYIKIMQMFLNQGVYNGHRVLSERVIAEMTKDQIAGVAKLRSPGGEMLPGYSFGWWISDPKIHPESRGPELSDQGAFGSTPWIDLDLNYSAHLLILKRTSVGSEIWSAIRPLIIEQIRKLP